MKSPLICLVVASTAFLLTPNSLFTFSGGPVAIDARDANPGVAQGNASDFYRATPLAQSSHVSIYEEFRKATENGVRAHVVNRTSNVLRPSVAFHDATPVARLPAHVRAAEGQVSLYADFASAHEDGVPLFVVNRSTEVVSWHVQDGDPFLKLEYCDEEKNWRRAQPHAFGGCGLSYGYIQLRPGNFLARDGCVHRRGRPAHVRYRFYSGNGIASNVGEALVDEDQVRLASSDSLSVSDWSLSRVEHVALGKEPIANTLDGQDIRARAIHELLDKRFTPEIRSCVLKKLKAVKEKRSLLTILAVDELEKHTSGE